MVTLPTGEQLCALVAQKRSISHNGRSDHSSLSTTNTSRLSDRLFMLLNKKYSSGLVAIKSVLGMKRCHYSLTTYLDS
jgi:hypothetical protein